MAAFQTHPPPRIPSHVLHSAPNKPHTHPQSSPSLLARGTLQPSTLPVAYGQPPKSLQHYSAPPSLVDPGPSSLPVTATHRTTTTLTTVSGETSVASLENARYRLGEVPRSEHSNEDRHFKLEEPYCKVLGVFDGHDGPRAAGFSSNFFIQFFSSDSWKTVISLPPNEQRIQIPMALKEFFKAAEREFFNSIRHHIEEKQQLQKTIPQHMTSYEAYLKYPVEVARMQELEPRIAGGTTVVVAVICGSRLYVANVGDSRAVLVNENEKGIQQIVQLSVDHSVENLDELKRLMHLGLDREQLQHSGRLGSHENTRSIGDYSIKAGYKDVDTLQHCTAQPGLCEPHVEVAPITPHCKYIMLMTDGVYKSIEATFEQQASIDSNKVLMSMVNHEQYQLVAQNRQFGILTDRVLERIRANHEDAYKRNATVDVRSKVAVACRKRDDMTLLVHQFQRGVALV